MAHATEAEVPKVKNEIDRFEKGMFQPHKN
jgi:hypothetical protein